MLYEPQTEIQQNDMVVDFSAHVLMSAFLIGFSPEVILIYGEVRRLMMDWYLGKGE